MAKEESLDSNKFGFIDILRVIGGLLFAICSMSYWFTGSTTWGYEGKWIDPRYLHFKLTNGYVNLTITELSQFDGSSGKLPIYVAINGSVYDVTSSAHIYGPGGSYKMFSGKDCARAFCTGCFNKPDELTYDLRGLDDAECLVEVGKWKRFFENHEKYWYVGTVEHEPITGEIPGPCQHMRYPGH